MIVQHYLWPKGSLSRRWPENEYWIYHIIRYGNKLSVIQFPLSLQLKNKDMPSKWDKSGYFICLFAKWQFSCILKEFFFFISLIYVINCQKFQRKKKLFWWKYQWNPRWVWLPNPECQICYHWNMDSGIVPLEFRVDIILCQRYNIMSYALW